MAPVSAKKRKGDATPSARTTHLDDVLADLACEDPYDFNRNVESYSYERYQATSVLPTDSITRAPTNFRMNPFQSVYFNTRDMFLETDYTVEMQTATNRGWINILNIISGNMLTC
jgi:hypothetical protein